MEGGRGGSGICLGICSIIYVADTYAYGWILIEKHCISGDGGEVLLFWVGKGLLVVHRACGAARVWGYHR